MPFRLLILLALAGWVAPHPCGSLTALAATPREAPERLTLTFPAGTRSAEPVALAGAGNEHLFLWLEM